MVVAKHKLIMHVNRHCSENPRFQERRKPFNTIPSKRSLKSKGKKFYTTGLMALQKTTTKLTFSFALDLHQRLHKLFSRTIGQHTRTTTGFCYAGLL